MELPETRFAWNEDVALAYQRFGKGAHDLLYLPGVLSNVDVMWEWPPYAQFLRRLGSFARVVTMDRRGYGCSDRFSPDALVPLEVMVDDVLVVLDAAEMEGVVGVFGFEDGATLAAMLAASKPERVSHLVLLDPAPSWTNNDELPWEWTRERWEEHIAMFRRTWGVMSAERIADEARYWAEAGLELPIDKPKTRWSARMERATMGPGAMVAETRKFMEIDIRRVLPTIHVPTLILHRPRDTYDPRTTRYVADHIDGARYIEVHADSGIHPWAEGGELLADEIQEFISGTRRGSEPNRVLVTVMFTDIVGSTTRAAELGDTAWHRLLEGHHQAVRAELSKFGGAEQDTAGDGFFAAFDGPAKAVRCAQGISDAVRSLGLEVRIGLHTGECEVVDGKVSGIAAVIGARVMAQASPSEILVSRTVKDLVAGSGLVFEDAGEHELKGVPEHWHLFRVVG